jgi:hypothetical protein
MMTIIRAKTATDKDPADWGTIFSAIIFLFQAGMLPVPAYLTESDAKAVLLRRS